MAGNARGRMEFHIPEGATPLNPDVRAGLIPSLWTQDELDEWEQRNITDGWRWARRSRTLRRDLLSAAGLRLLHRRLFGHTWRWAGDFRQTQTNLGVSCPQIPVQVAALCADAQYQIDHDVYAWDERAARFHHRLVSIHPFPNGNGRHARIAADLWLAFHGQPPFTWGANALPGLSLARDTAVRQSYLRALRAADRGDGTAAVRPFLTRLARASPGSLRTSS